MSAESRVRPLSCVAVGFGRAVFARAVGLAGLAIVTALLTWAAGTPVSCLANLGTSTREGFDQLLPATAGAVAWCALLWFLTVVAVEIAASWPGLAGQLCSRLAARCAPTTMRAAARWLAGITLVVAPLCSVAAVAAAATGATPNLDRPAASAMATPTEVDLDRPQLPSPPTAPQAAPPAARAPGDQVASATDPEAAPGTTSYIAPAPPAAVKVAASDDAPLLLGTPHRDVDDEGGYVVHRGDALWNIAARHLGPDATAADIAREWPRWYAANRAVIGADPNLLRPGEVLHAPLA